MLDGVKITFLGVVATAVLGCTDAIPEFNRLEPLDPIGFSGKNSKVIHISSLGPPVEISGECSRKITGVLLSKNGTDWLDAQATLKERFENLCASEGQVKLSFLTDNKGVLQFVPGTPSSHEIRLLAVEGKDRSPEANLQIVYSPTTKIPVAGSLLYPSAGQLTGTQHKIKYRFGASVDPNLVGVGQSVKSNQ